MNHAVILLLSYGIIRTELHPIKNSRRELFKEGDDEAMYKNSCKS